MLVLIIEVVIDRLVVPNEANP